MNDLDHLDHLDWPFFEPGHRDLARELDAWAARTIPHRHGPDVDAGCRALVKLLGVGGWLQHAVGTPAVGAGRHGIDTRAICLIRETLARYSGLADFAFALQGLGSGAISLQGTPRQKESYLGRVARGEAIAAFALSEPDAGSDVAAMQCGARIEGDHAVLDGPGRGARGISAFIGGRRFQVGDAHARRVPHLRRRGGARLRAARDGRSTAACQHPQDVRPAARRLPADAGQVGADIARSGRCGSTKARRRCSS